MNINFDSRSVAPSQPMEPVPEGWYPVVIAEEEQKGVANKPQCWFLSLVMEIIDGPAKGRKLFANLNLGNDNMKAVEIAHRELSAICHVTGQFVLSEQTGGTAALKGKPFMVKVIVSESRNEIKGYKDMMGNDPGKTGGQGAHAPAAPVAPPAPPAMAPQAPAAPAWGAQPAAPQQPQQPQQPAWGAPAQQPQPQQFAPQQAPQQPAAPAWGAPQPAQAAPGAPAWGGGAPAPVAAPAPAAAPAWAPAAGGAPQQAPWAR